MLMYTQHVARTYADNTCTCELSKTLKSHVWLVGCYLLILFCLVYFCKISVLFSQICVRFVFLLLPTLHTFKGSPKLQTSKSNQNIKERVFRTRGISWVMLLLIGYYFDNCLIIICFCCCCYCCLFITLVSNFSVCGRFEKSLCLPC